MNDQFVNDRIRLYANKTNDELVAMYHEHLEDATAISEQPATDSYHNRIRFDLIDDLMRIRELYRRILIIRLRAEGYLFAEVVVENILTKKKHPTT